MEMTGMHKMVHDQLLGKCHLCSALTTARVINLDTSISPVEVIMCRNCDLKVGTNA